MKTFRDGDVELPMRTRQQRFQSASLFFQRFAAGDVQMEGE